MIVAGGVVLTLALTGVFNSDSDGGTPDSPDRAVRATFDALKVRDTDALRTTLCAKDSPQDSLIIRAITLEKLASFSILNPGTAPVVRRQGSAARAVDATSVPGASYGRGRRSDHGGNAR